MLFPVEIFEEILQYCDPVDLLRYKSVCWTWNAMISRILDKQTDVWHKKCLRDIPEEMQSSIFRSAFRHQTFFMQYVGPPDWMELWKSWVDWRNLFYMEPTSIDFEPLPRQSSINDEITCISLLDNIIAIGSCEGYIVVFSMNSSEILGAIDAREYVSDLKLSGTADLLAVAMVGVTGRTKLWSLKKKIATIVEDYNTAGGIALSRIAQWFNAHFHAGSLYTFESEQINILTPTLDEGCIEGMKFSLRIQLLGGKVLAAAVDKNEIFAWIDNNRHCTIHFFDKCGGYISNLRNANQHPDVPIRRYQIFKPRVTACIGELGQFGFSVDCHPWKMYNLFSKFFAPVTAILFHVSTLALGLESGEVHVFRVENVDDLENLDFDDMESMKINLHSGAIISLNVTEYDSSPVIVAADTRRVFVIRFIAS